MDIIGYITYGIFIAALTISFLLMGLIWWHSKMINRGVTSVERISHQNYIQQCIENGFVFVNPYDFGLLENWKRFFNVRTIGEFIRRVLLPSTHKPKGNGVLWSYYNVYNNLQPHRFSSKSPRHLPAFPPDVYADLDADHRINNNQVLMSPWKKQQTSLNTSVDSESNTSLIKTVDSKKDR